MKTLIDIMQISKVTRAQMIVVVSQYFNNQNIFYMSKEQLNIIVVLSR